MEARPEESESYLWMSGVLLECLHYGHTRRNTLQCFESDGRLGHPGQEPRAAPKSPGRRGNASGQVFVEAKARVFGPDSELDASALQFSVLDRRRHFWWLTS